MPTVTVTWAMSYCHDHRQRRGLRWRGFGDVADAADAVNAGVYVLVTAAPAAAPAAAPVVVVVVVVVVAGHEVALSCQAAMLSRADAYTCHNTMIT